MKETYIDIAIKHYEKRIKNLNVWLDNLSADKFMTCFDRKESSNFSLPLILKNKDKCLWSSVLNILEELNIEYRVGTAGGGNQERQPYLREGKYKYRVQGKLNKANHIHEYGLYLGNHTEVNSKMILDLCRRLNNV